MTIEKISKASTGMIILAIVLFLLLYVLGAVHQITQINIDMQVANQSAYMHYASNLRDSNYTFIGGRNRMPLYPLLQSLIYHPGLPDEAFFFRGKLFNLALSICLIAGLAFIFTRFFHWLHAVNLLLIVSFEVFIFRAGYIQVELLFYFLNFLLFLLMCANLVAPNIRLAALTGFTAGLAHLTKASILPGLVAFLVVSGISLVFRLFRDRKYLNKSSMREWWSKLSAIMLVGAVFLVTIFPYIQTSKRVFNRYFYNVNSTFYIWYDSWREVRRGTRAHGDRIGWPQMPAEDIPSMRKYFREHTYEQVFRRVIDGGRDVVNKTIHSFGYAKFIVGYTGLLLAAGLFNLREVRSLAIQNKSLLAFLFLYFAGYFLLYSWYAPISSSVRLSLAQFLPFVFSLCYGIQILLGKRRILLRGRSINTLVLINLVVLPLVLVDIYFVLTSRILTLFGGS